MMESFSLETAQPKRPAYMWVAALLSLVGLFAYGWIYYFEPFSEISKYVNDKIGDTFILIPAVAAAALGLLLTRHFKPSEPPFRIWLAFTLGWWFWVGGELLGYVYDYFYWDVAYPEFTWIDFCWIGGYILFGLSLYYQFRLIYVWKKGHQVLQYLLLIALAALLAVGLTQWALAAGLGEGYSWAAVYVAVLYPVFDVVEGGAAIWLFFLFGRGYLGRPWWGLIAFAFADSINIYSWMGGFDHAPETVYAAVDLFSALAYMGGYIVTALAFLSANDRIRRSLGALPVADQPDEKG